MFRGLLRFLQATFILLDLVILNLSYLYAQEVFQENIQSKYYLRYQQYFVFMNAFWILCIWIDAMYTTRHITYFNGFLKKTLRAFGFWSILMIVYLFLPRRVELSQGLVYTTVSIFFIGLMVNRFIYLGIKEWVGKMVDNKRKILILGYNDLSLKLADYLDQDAVGIQIMGYVDDTSKITQNSNYPVYNNISDALRLSKQLRVNEVFSTIMPEDNSEVYHLMQQADKDLIRFRIVPDFATLINRPIHIDHIRDLPIFTIRREPLEQVVNRGIKRAFDILVSLFVTIFILSWLIPLLGLLIKMESKGPIFFVQLRSGKNNRPFRCYKFRSMGVNRSSEAVQATKNDIRVTRIGKIIRKTSLDEFPQFLNVLNGQMSIVGPRPHMLKHTKDFANLADDYMIRQYLKPGITGWAQVNGFRGEIRELVHIKKRVEYDLWYLENWSLSLDLRIMFLTVYNVFKGEENAY